MLGISMGYNGKYSFTVCFTIQNASAPFFALENFLFVSMGNHQYKRIYYFFNKFVVKEFNHKIDEK
jgi:hypothetical protein